MVTEKKIQISIYLRNSQLGPSDYYRIYQYTPYFNGTCRIHNALNEEEYNRNLNMVPSIRKKMYQGILFVKIYFRRIRSIMQDLKCGVDIVIVKREVFPHVLGPCVGKLLYKLCKKCKVIWDFDDYIFLNNEVSKRERKILERTAKQIIVTNEFLKSKLSNWAKEKVILLPTTDGFYKKYNLDNVRDNRIESYNKELRLVWVGTQSTLKHVEGIVSYLEEAARQLKKLNKELILTVVCNVALQTKTDYLRINNIQWTREKAEEAIINAHVGIMPLQNIEYALGKGGFKLIQYISTGMPVLASDVGFNSEIVKGEIGKLISTVHEEDWIVEVVRMGVDKESWINSGKSAQKRYNDQYSIELNINVWQSLVENKL